MDSQLQELTTVAEVIEALARAPSVAALTGRTANAVYNWKSFGKFPSDTFVVLQEALRARGLTAPAALWGMVTAPEAATAEAAE